MPSTFRACASATARSIASPASLPALVSESPRFHIPMLSATSASVPVGPTTTSVAARDACPSRIILATISGQLPRGSPRVTARRGSVTSRTLRRARRGSGLQRVVEPDRDVGLFAQTVQHAAEGAFVRQLLTHAIAQVGKLVFPA